MIGPRRRQGAVRHGAVLAGVLLVCSSPAFALNPALDVSQYAHTAWKIRDGFSKGIIQAMAQTPDGYLWLGTEFGLLRFDGVRNVPWQPPAGESLPDNFIRSLLSARDGALWIGTLKGLARWKSGKLTSYPELAGQAVDSLIEDREGTVWAAGQVIPTGRLCAIHGDSVRCYGEDGSLGRWVESLHQDARGNLWAAAETGLWRWMPGPAKRYVLSDPIRSTLDGLAEGGNGALLILTLDGIRQFSDGHAEAFSPSATSQIHPSTLFRDRDGGLWIGTDKGLVHVHQGRVDLFARSDGLSADHITRLFEDRESNIWVATSEGLDRFREYAAATLSASEGVPNGVGAVLAARDGSVWLSHLESLSRLSDGQIEVYRGRAARQSAVREIVVGGLPEGVLGSLFQDHLGRLWIGTSVGLGYLEDDRFISVGGVPGGGLNLINSIAEDTRGDLWIANQNLGLFRLFGGNQIQQVPWTRLGSNDSASRVAADPTRDGLWLGFRLGGVAHYVDDHIRESYAPSEGLGRGRVNYLRVDPDGALWAATEGGLSRVKNGRVATLSTKNGLPCDSVDWMIDDDVDSSWLYMACGLVRIPRSALDAWAAAVDKDIAPKPTIETTSFDSSDGVRSVAVVSTYSPHAAKSPDGKLWFASPDGVTVVDPQHLPFNKLPPPVHIEQITADRRTYDVPSAQDQRVSLPALIRDLQIDYTALSLVAPEQMRFRYMLEGWDPNWQDVGTRRQAFYNNLPPRNYRFRVIASNNSGVWNETGAYLDFSVEPAYYQTAWFRWSMAAAFLALLGAVYQLRARQVARQFALRLDERVNERTRIARDLHDTLLQSFHGVLLRFQAATFLLPDRPADAQEVLKKAIDEASQAITEGRDAVQGLRTSTVASRDLTEVLGALGKELAADSARPHTSEFLLQVEGTARALAPLVQDEVYRIAREALRNAFKHADARRIEVEIRYGDRQFRLRVRDDGRGMDQKIVDEGGRAGHYGLAGMRERATLLRGTLTVWSEPGTGTEIELTIPGTVAFTKSSASRTEPAD